MIIKLLSQLIIYYVMVNMLIEHLMKTMLSISVIKDGIETFISDEHSAKD